ncbi:MAG: zinc ribbon domain-containing protein [Phoenicibacter congonensis]|uniref:Zinc ribbon domain-containing protein n=1 Tax=Phoenicibacter congonensis TaxID=1944646 RepID=A0AA43UB95_9ACTN|nr:zinc ribbon domain-containing protein [Phoenicibacter congonensis]
MLRCSHCGAEVAATDEVCKNCGYALVKPEGTAYAQNYQVAPAPAPQVQYTESGMTKTDENLRLAAFVVAVVTTVCAGFFIIPLAWMIPMTVHTWKIYKGERANTVCFGVCSLLFLDLITGVLLLCSNKDQ